MLSDQTLDAVMNMGTSGSIRAHRDVLVWAVPEVGAVEDGLEGDPHHGALGDEVGPQPRVPHCRAVCAVRQHRQHAHRLLHTTFSGSKFSTLNVDPGWRGSVQILSTVPTVDWVLLGSGESNKG